MVMNNHVGKSNHETNVLQQLTAVQSGTNLIAYGVPMVTAQKALPTDVNQKNG